MLEDFYPTPKSLIYKMLNGINMREITSVLEPSAGKGDICDVIKSQQSIYSRNTEVIDVIEINPDLQHILRGKGYNLINDDFLSFETRKIYDLIIANFPFSEGEHHLAHALHLIKENGGQLVALVNAETIKNPVTKVRQRINSDLIAFGASIEFLSGEFVNAERSTNVEVALIKVNFRIEPTFSILLDELTRAAEAEAEELPENDLIERDFKKAMVARFDLECNVGANLINEYWALRPHIASRYKLPTDSFEASPLIELKVLNCTYRESRAHLINTYLKGVRQKYWQLLVNDPRYTGQYTTNMLEDLRRKLDELKNCDFNLFNIEQLAKDLAMRVTQGVEKAILDLFDKCSRNFAWDESIHQKNVHYYNGWKTNKAWKINKKVILPMNGIGANYGRGHRWEYRIQEELTDMVKVFNYLSPVKADVKQLVGFGMEAAERNQTFECDFRYFSTKFYKKGTCHITFHDMDLLDKFNIFGSQRKGWLPPAYGKKAYEDLSRDERETVDTFQGRAGYEAVIAEPEKYLVPDAYALLGGEGGAE